MWTGANQYIDFQFLPDTFTGGLDEEDGWCGVMIMMVTVWMTCDKSPTQASSDNKNGIQYKKSHAKGNDNGQYNRNDILYIAHYYSPYRDYSCMYTNWIMRVARNCDWGILESWLTNLIIKIVSAWQTLSSWQRILSTVILYMYCVYKCYFSCRCFSLVTKINFQSQYRDACITIHISLYHYLGA